MISKEIKLAPEHIYPLDDWKIIQKKFAPQYLAQDETVFATGNGYLGLRGNHEEGTPVVQRGTYINGFHEQWPIRYGESAYGFAKTGQTMLNVTDSKVIRLYVDDEPFYLPTAHLKSYERVLDMKAGALHRDILWETASGKRVSIRSTRIVSMERRHVAAISYEVKVLNAPARLIISSKMRCPSETGEPKDEDPRKARAFEHSVYIPHVNQVKDQRILLGHQVHTSKMTLACGVDHEIQSDSTYTHQSECYEDSAKIVYSVNAQAGESFRLVKYMVYHTSRSAPAIELCGRAERTLNSVMKEGFDELAKGQQRYMDDFWERSDIEVTMRKDRRTQPCLRFNLFHILQASARVEGTGIGARGLTGDAYEGHYFWDTEIYLMPFLIYTSPNVAKILLRFRHSLLDKARKRAAELNQKGALFPWRTITGDEASAYFAAGTAQYHINADIMYALRKYVEVTGDEEFLFDYGAEMLIETARLWADLGFYSHDGKDQFHIHGVTGPDEYTAIVNNNTFTNMMARENLRYAAESLELMQKKRPERFEALVHDTDLLPEEIDEWRKAAEHMYIPYNEKRGIHPQDDGFLKKEVWDFENTPMDKYPLLLNYHPLVIYRFQVIKQADVAMVMFLLDHEFSLEQKKRNFDYYDPLTTGDSSLSACVHSILAVELGYLDRAVELIRYAAWMDLADVGGNVKDGAHIASMGGTWMAIAYGLAGLRDHGGRISFNPKSTLQATKVRFPLTVRGQMIEVKINEDTVKYSLKKGEGLTIYHGDEEINLSEDQPSKVMDLASKVSE
ncbi:MAG: glycoside hydrolase family 65 protein [Flavobacteriaceae bacterium]